MTFTDPGTRGDNLPIVDLVGSLLLITVHEETDPIPTEYGESTAIRADVAVLDGGYKAKVFADTLIFQRILKSQLRGAVGGGKVLGRLELGEKKPGKNPPYQLAAANPDEKTTAQKYLAHQASLQIQAPSDEEPFINLDARWSDLRNIHLEL